MSNTDLDKAIQLIQQGDCKQAIEVLLRMAPHAQPLIELSARLGKADRDLGVGVLKRAHYDHIHANVCQGLLSFINDFRQQAEKPTFKPQATEKQNGSAAAALKRIESPTLHVRRSITANQVVDFSRQIHQIDKKSLRAFLLDLSETLMDADLGKMQSNFMFEVSRLVQALRTKIFPSDERHPREKEMLYAEIKSLTQSLEHTVQTGRLDREYFKNVYELGLMLKDLASVIR